MTLHAPITLRSADNQLFVSGYLTEKPHCPEPIESIKGSIMYDSYKLAHEQWLASKIEIPVSEGSKEWLYNYSGQSFKHAQSFYHREQLEAGIDISELAGRIVCKRHIIKMGDLEGPTLYEYEPITLLPEKEGGQDELWDELFDVWTQASMDDAKPSVKHVLMKKFTITKNK